MLEAAAGESRRWASAAIPSCGQLRRSTAPHVTRVSYHTLKIHHGHPTRATSTSHTGAGSPLAAAAVVAVRVAPRTGRSPTIALPPWIALDETTEDEPLENRARGLRRIRRVAPGSHWRESFSPLSRDNHVLNNGGRGTWSELGRARDRARTAAYTPSRDADAANAALAATCTPPPRGSRARHLAAQGRTAAGRSFRGGSRRPTR